MAKTAKKRAKKPTGKTSRTASKKTSPHKTMLNLIIGYWVARLVEVAASLSLADRLEKGPRTAAQLAAATGIGATDLYRVMRALASVGVFAETKDGKFKLTPLAATLRTDAPGSMRTSAMLLNAGWQWDAWQQLLPALKSGEVPFDKAHGMPVFEYLEKHPADLAVFHKATTGLTNPAVAEAYNFSKFKTVVDVGGGHGALLATILKAHPKVKGTLFDQPSVIAGAANGGHVTAKSVAGRCTLEKGNFFTNVPKGADVYTLKYLLHDWNDERSVQILKNCRAAMHGKSRLLVIDSVIPPGNGPDYVKLLDIEMLTIGGRERTKADFAAIFRAAGLKLTRVIPTRSPLSIVEGVRA
jgi:hypothetical protein